MCCVSGRGTRSERLKLVQLTKSQSHLSKFPDTKELFEKFQSAYLDWADLNYRTHDTVARTYAIQQPLRI